MQNELFKHSVEEKNLPISEIMRIREIELGETASENCK